MKSTGQNALTGAFCLAFVVIVWGTNWLGIKDALSVSPPLFFTGIRLLGGALFVAAGCYCFGRTFRLGKVGRLRILCVGLLQMGCGLGLSLAGLQYLDAGRSALLFYTMPLWLVLIERAVGHRRQSLFELTALFAGLLGLLLLITEGGFGIFSGNITGIALLLIAAFCWALGTWIHQHGPSDTDIWSRIFIQLATSGGFLLLVSWLFEPSFDLARSPDLYGSLAFNCILATGVAFAAWYQALSDVSSRLASQSLVLVPVVALITSALLLGEEITVRVVVASLLISSGVILVAWGAPAKVQTHAETT
ncbi:MAG: DMT family transporter [Hyphomicrobiales bacterium]|nr:DMT family transporter [Hyphomicrobiales bacterium]